VQNFPHFYALMASDNRPIFDRDLGPRELESARLWEACSFVLRPDSAVGPGFENFYTTVRLLAWDLLKTNGLVSNQGAVLWRCGELLSQHALLLGSSDPEARKARVLAKECFDAARFGGLIESSDDLEVDDQPLLLFHYTAESSSELREAPTTSKTDQCLLGCLIIIDLTFRLGTTVQFLSHCPVWLSDAIYPALFMFLVVFTFEIVTIYFTTSIEAVMLFHPNIHLTYFRLFCIKIYITASRAAVALVSGYGLWLLLPEKFPVIIEFVGRTFLCIGLFLLTGVESHVLLTEIMLTLCMMLALGLLYRVPNSGKAISCGRPNGAHPTCCCVTLINRWLGF